jgi:hypothetical protein
VARERYYHPRQHGSWSIKSVVPAAIPDLSYESLDGVQDGASAAEAFLEFLRNETSANRKSEIASQLSAYCRLDTFALVRLWQLFRGRGDPPFKDNFPSSAI